MANTKVNMLEGSIAKALLAFTIPFLVSSVFQQLYNTADTIIVGRMLGESALAAIGSSSVLYETLLGFALGIGNGMSIVTARCFGAGEYNRMRQSVAGAIVVDTVVAVVLTVAAQLFCRPILVALHTPADILEDAQAYITTITLFLGVMLAYNLCAGMLKAVGDSVVPLVFLILSSILNIILDLLFIGVCHTGIRGAAIATVLAQSVSVVLCIGYICVKYKELLPGRAQFRPSIKLYTDLLGQGLSMGLMSSLVSTGTVVMQSSINHLGYLIIAGHTAAKKIRSIFMMPISTMGMALTTFVSQNRGADQGGRIRKAIRLSNLFGLGWAVLITVVLAAAAPGIVKLVSGSAHEEVLHNGALYLQLEAPFFAILSVLFNTRYSLQGIGAKILPLASSLIELAGKILFALFWIPRLGYFGVIICEPVIWCLMALELVIAFYTHPYIRASRSKAAR